MRCKGQGFGAKIPIVRGPTRKPVGPPAAGQSRVQQRQANRAGGIGLLNLWKPIAGFWAGDDHNSQLPVFELLAGFVRVNHFWPGRLCQFTGQSAQTTQCGLLENNEAPRLQLAMIWCARSTTEKRL